MLGFLYWHLLLKYDRIARSQNLSMSRYIIQVTDTQPIECANPQATVPATQEIFKLGVDEFDPLTFCAALKAKKVGRKAKAGKEGV